jgi:hypothetical protein
VRWCGPPPWMQGGRRSAASFTTSTWSNGSTNCSHLDHAVTLGLLVRGFKRGSSGELKTHRASPQITHAWMSTEPTPCGCDRATPAQPCTCRARPSASGPAPAPSRPSSCLGAAIDATASTTSLPSAQVRACSATLRGSREARRVRALGRHGRRGRHLRPRLDAQAAGGPRPPGRGAPRRPPRRRPRPHRRVQRHQLPPPRAGDASGPRVCGTCTHGVRVVAHTAGRRPPPHVAHRDRLCRFAFDLIEDVLRRCGAVVAVDSHDPTTSTPEGELARAPTHQSPAAPC